MATKYQGPPMDLANMRENGARGVWLYCDCGHQACVNVDALPADIYVPDVKHHFRCSKCGAAEAVTARLAEDHRPMKSPVGLEGLKAAGSRACRLVPLS